MVDEPKKYTVLLFSDGVEKPRLCLHACTDPKIDTHTISFTDADGKRIASNLPWTLVEE